MLQKRRMRRKIVSAFFLPLLKLINIITTGSFSAGVELFQSPIN